MNGSFNSEKQEWPCAKDFQDLIEAASLRIKILQSKTSFAKRFRIRSGRYVARLQRLSEACKRGIADFWIDKEIEMISVYNYFSEEFASVYEAIEEDLAMSYLLIPEELTEYTALASALLASEKYLSGPDLAVIESVVSKEIFNVLDFHRIALNHGFLFRTWLNPVR